MYYKQKSSVHIFTAFYVNPPRCDLNNMSSVLRQFSTRYRVENWRNTLDISLKSLLGVIQVGTLPAALATYATSVSGDTKESELKDSIHVALWTSLT